MSDITANVVVSMPSQLFTMARSFKAVANGKIYIGKIDTDPVNPENQIQVYVENEDGSHVPVSQPIIINAAGYPVYNGQIAKFVTVQGHSMAVYDAYGTQQFYFPNVLKYDPDQLKTVFYNTLNWVTPDQFKTAEDPDDTESFYRALKVSKTIHLLEREYFATEIKTSDDDICIVGQGSQKTKITASSAGEYLLNIGGTDSNPATVRERISIRGVTLDGNNLVTNTLITCASQSPNLCEDVVVKGAISHGFVHSRGWSTFSKGLVCRNNGENGLRLVGDNNNTHWEGMFSENGTIGIYVNNSAGVSFSGSIENNGEEGAVIDASSSILPGYVNTVTSSVLFTDACYFESNGKKTPGTYAEVRFGGDGGGIVRDCIVQGAHIGVPENGIGVKIRATVKRLHLDSAGIYPVGSPLAYIQYSGAFTSMSSVISADCRFTNIDVPAFKILSEGFTDTDGSLSSYVLGGGTACPSDKSDISRSIRLLDENNIGTYLEKIYRGTNLISERGVKPNTQLWNNAANESGYHSYAINGVEKLRLNPRGYLKAFSSGTPQSLTSEYHEISAAVDSGSQVLSIINQYATAPNILDLHLSNSNPSDTTSWFLRCRAKDGANKLYIYNNGDVVNRNNSYGAISDKRLKERITDANSAWDEFKKYRFVNYYLKDNPTKKMLGVISQEIKEVSPEIVGHHQELVLSDTGERDENGEVIYKESPTGRILQSVNYSVLYLKASIALQEAIDRIERLEETISILQNKIS